MQSTRIFKGGTILLVIALAAGIFAALALADGIGLKGKGNSNQGQNQNCEDCTGSPNNGINTGMGNSKDAPDDDGDGIPNGQDPDYVRSGFGRGHGFVDADGDGINDFAQDADGDGIPNGQDPDYVCPQDGSGKRMGNGLRQAGSAMGSKLLRGFRGGSNTGTGICTGTGPVGMSKGRGK